jgi:hypothetical protein
MSPPTVSDAPVVQAAPPAAPSGGRALELDPDLFRANFNRKPYLMPHNLVGHPSFSLPRLIELAKRLPPEYVEYNAGNIPLGIDWHVTPQTGLSVEETIRRIEECCSWMVLKRVEQDPEYNELLTRCLDDVQALSEPLDPGMGDRAGAIFISSPGAVTPYHMDIEYNFLLQLRGGKTIAVFPGKDRTLLSEEELEDHVTRKDIDRNLVYREEYMQKADVFDLKTGSALHIPSHDPHWVRNGPEVSISFSVAFLTRASDRQRVVHQFNHRLRKLGLRPSPYGHSRWRDSLKYTGCRAWRRVARLWTPARKGP